LRSMVRHSNSTGSDPAFRPSSSLHGSEPVLSTIQCMITRKPPRVGGSKYCVQNKRFVNRQDVFVTEDGKLQNVIVYVHSGYEGRSYTAPTEPVLLDQQHCVYVPHVFTIMTNQKVTVRNSDDTFHNVPAMPMTNPVVNLAQPMMGMQNTVTFAYREMPFRIGC